ncbi:hypothetical protein ERJ75_000295200 [Trypanosoma vivax]|uniref:Uncharacterized protein n=1 Tax=Trypanosoma vivax (strain Y486) TaxID=1055687 RepID=F9WMK2_TRYVY|nr:hypothetical protein ERJ75_000295200 [Trypanosoma vivax]CCD18759.1 hypothetical protein, conserved in T. vivax [Trypanosoma vivax Y486]|eukprot:CCD18759.1 hypothetical protein, conserved in T. vivax [Trypanosoma vivax Y486]
MPPRADPRGNAWRERRRVLFSVAWPGLARAAVTRARRSRARPPKLSPWHHAQDALTGPGHVRRSPRTQAPPVCQNGPRERSTNDDNGARPWDVQTSTGGAVGEAKCRGPACPRSASCVVAFFGRAPNAGRCSHHQTSLVGVAGRGGSASHSEQGMHAARARRAQRRTDRVDKSAREDARHTPQAMPAWTEGAGAVAAGRASIDAG